MTHIYIKPSNNERSTYLTRSVRRRAATSKRACVDVTEVFQKRGFGDRNASGIWRRRASLNHISVPFVDGSGPRIQLYPAKRLGTGTEPVTSIKLPSTAPN